MFLELMSLVAQGVARSTLANGAGVCVCGRGGRPVNDAPGMKVGKAGGDLEGDPHFALGAEGLDAGPVAVENDGVHAAVLTELEDDSEVWLSVGRIREF